MPKVQVHAEGSAARFPQMDQENVAAISEYRPAIAVMLN
jgi:hypothetical protein